MRRGTSAASSALSWPAKKDDQPSAARSGAVTICRCRRPPKRIRGGVVVSGRTLGFLQSAGLFLLIFQAFALALLEIVVRFLGQSAHLVGWRWRAYTPAAADLLVLQAAASQGAARIVASSSAVGKARAGAVTADGDGGGCRPPSALPAATADFCRRGRRQARRDRCPPPRWYRERSRERRGPSRGHRDRPR